MKKFVKSKLVLQIVMISLAATLATAGIIGATTIGANILTTGTLGTATTTITAGDLIVDGDTLVVDNDNNKVGIGTSTPGYLLDVDGDFNVGIVAKPSTFYVDTANERVGIGSTTPTSQLSVGTLNATSTVAMGNICFFGGYDGVTPFWITLDPTGAEVFATTTNDCRD